MVYLGYIGIREGKMETTIYYYNMKASPASPRP